MHRKRSVIIHFRTPIINYMTGLLFLHAAAAAVAAVAAAAGVSVDVDIL